MDVRHNAGAMTMEQGETSSDVMAVLTLTELDASIEMLLAPVVNPVEPKLARTWWIVSFRGRAIWTGPAWTGVEAADIAGKAYCLNEPGRFKMTAEPIERPKKGAQSVLGRLRP